MVPSSSKHIPLLYGWNLELVLSPQGIPSIVVDEFLNQFHPSLGYFFADKHSFTPTMGFLCVLILIFYALHCMLHLKQH
jgi:hypothetical protein